MRLPVLKWAEPTLLQRRARSAANMCTDGLPNRSAFYYAHPSAAAAATWNNTVPPSAGIKPVYESLRVANRL